MLAASKMALADGGGDADDGGFARAGGRNVLSVNEHDFDFGQVGETGDAVVGEAGVGQSAVFKFDGLEKRAAQAHDHRAFHLVLQMIGVDDRAAVEGADGAERP